MNEKLYLSYDEFMNIVPSETKEFVDQVGGFLWRNMQILPSYNFTSDSQTRAVILLTNSYLNTKNSNVQQLLISLEFKGIVRNKSFFEFRKLNGCVDVSARDGWKQISDIFNICSSQDEYQRLTSDLIVLKFVSNYLLELKDINEESYVEYIKTLFPEIHNDNIGQISEIFEKSYKKLIQESNRKSNYRRVPQQMLTKKAKNLLPTEINAEPISFKGNYLEAAAIIYGLLDEEIPYNTKIVNNIEDKISASLLVALKLVPNYIDAILEKKFGVSTYLECLRIDYQNIDYKNQDPSFDSFSEKVLENYPKGKIIFNLETASVEDLFERIVMDSSVFRKMKAQYKCTNSDFVNFKNDVKSVKIMQFYGNLPIESIEQIELASKIYNKLLGKNKRSSSSIFSSEEDISAVSLLLADFYMPNNSTEFLIDNNITFERCIDYLKVSYYVRDKSDLLFLEPVDINVITKQYKKYIYEGNESEELSSLTPFHISRKLFSRDFTGSTIIEKIIHALNPQLKVTDDFTLEFDKYIEGKKKEKEKFFYKNLPKETVKYIKKASLVFEEISHQDSMSDYSSLDMVELSLLISLAYNEKSNIKELFITSIDLKKFELIMSMPNCDELTASNSNINLVIEYYNSYIFEGCNEDKDSSQITIDNVAMNIFSREINDSYNIERLLERFNSSYSSFEDLDKKLHDYVLNKEKQNEQNAKDLVYNKPNDVIKYFEIVSKIYQMLEEIYNSNNCNKQKIKHFDDIITLSLLLGLFEDNNCIAKFLAKNNISLNKCLEYFGIHTDDFVKYINKEISYKILEEKFSTYLDNPVSDSLKLLTSIMYTPTANILFEKLLSYFNINYDEFELTIQKDGEQFINKLQKEKQLKSLMNITPPLLIPETLADIVEFGNDLKPHSQLIVSGIVDFVEIISDTESYTVEVREILDSIGPVKEVKQSFFEKLFAKKVPLVEESSLSDKKEMLDKLKNLLVNYEVAIKEEMDIFDYLKKIIALYIPRAQKYIDVLEAELDALSKNTKLYKENDVSIYDDKFKENILLEKINSFKTAIIMRIQEYQQISILAGTHTLLMSRLSSAIDIQLPTLYTELAINNGVETEQKGYATLNQLSILVNQVLMLNAKGIENSLSNIGELPISQEIVQIDSSTQKEIDKILEEQQQKPIEIKVDDSEVLNDTIGILIADLNLVGIDAYEKIIYNSNDSNVVEEKPKEYVYKKKTNG